MVIERAWYTLHLIYTFMVKSGYVYIFEKILINSLYDTTSKLWCNKYPKSVVFLIFWTQPENSLTQSSFGTSWPEPAQPQNFSTGRPLDITHFIHSSNHVYSQFVHNLQYRYILSTCMPVWPLMLCTVQCRLLEIILRNGDVCITDFTEKQIFSKPVVTGKYHILCPSSK